MTEHEFIRRRDYFRNCTAFAGLLVLVLFVASLIIAALIGDNRSHRSEHSPVLWSVALVLGVSALLLGYEWFARRLAKRLGLVCTRCGERISLTSKRVIDTGTCNKCCHQVFEKAVDA
jgi:hypothetical protein